MKKAVKDVAVEKPVEAAEAAVKTVKKAAEAASKTVKKAVEKKTAEKKAAPAKKTAAAKKAVKEQVYLQYLGKEINKDDLVKQVKDIWTKQLKRKVGDLASIDLYLKPEENAVYYVINGDVTGSIAL